MPTTSGPYSLEIFSPSDTSTSAQPVLPFEYQPLQQHSSRSLSLERVLVSNPNGATTANTLQFNQADTSGHLPVQYSQTPPPESKSDRREGAVVNSSQGSRENRQARLGRSAFTARGPRTDRRKRAVVRSPPEGRRWIGARNHLTMRHDTAEDRQARGERGASCARGVEDRQARGGRSAFAARGPRTDRRER